MILVYFAVARSLRVARSHMDHVKAFVEFKNKAENNLSNKRIRLYAMDGGVNS